MHTSVVRSARRRDRRLAFWIVAPVAAFVLLWIAIGSLPSVDCGEEPAADGTLQLTVILLIAACSSTACVAAAAWHLRIRLRARRPVARVAALLVAGAGGLAALALLAVLLGDISVNPVFDLMVVAAVPALALTGICLLVLVGSWAVGRDVEGTSAILSAYLLGAALVAYPASVLVALLAYSGVGC